jgi:hypothetical protein
LDLLERIDKHLAGIVAEHRPAELAPAIREAVQNAQSRLSHPH